MLVADIVAAARQVLSRPLRRILWRSLLLTLALIALIWFGLTRLFGSYLSGHPLSVDYPIVDGFAYFMAGAGLLIGLIYLMPVITMIVAGYYLDDVAEIVERTDFPGDPAGTPLSVGRSLLYALRFAGLALLVNLAALTLVFIPIVNVVAFFAANSYLFGREYFELAAGRFRPMPDAAALRRRHRGAVLLAGAVVAGLVLVPILNLATPLFGVALMIHVHKRLTRTGPSSQSVVV